MAPPPRDPTGPRRQGTGDEGAPDTSDEPRGPRWGALFLGLGVVGAVGLLVRTFLGPTPAPPPGPTASASADDAPPASAPAAPAGRCTPGAKDASFTIGEAPAPKPKDDDAGDDEAEEDLTAPFAVEIGRGARFDGGFAVGALRDAEGGTVATLVTVDDEGKNGRIVRLERSRGDVDPPVVAADGASVIIGMIEPNAGGRSLKIAKVTGEKIAWGPELAQGRDESMAFDLAVGARRAVAVWDDVEGTSKTSSVMLASFDAATMQSVTTSRPVSPPKTDADNPRVVRRPGGFWLTWIAHGEPPKSEATKAGADEEDDDGARGEAVGAAWIEIEPLDDDGVAAGAPRRATPKTGHVLAYDVEIGDDGAALVAYRDDESSSGGNGGSIHLVLARLGGIAEPKLVADEGVGVGVPDLLPGWIAVSSVTGPKRLAPMNGKGEIGGGLMPERAIGMGEVIAAAGEKMLVATPNGKAMRLDVVRCAAGPGSAAGADAGPSAAPAGSASAGH